MAHLLHRWDPWTDPAVVHMVSVDRRSGKITRYVEERQRRRCRSCGAVQERDIAQ